MKHWKIDLQFIILLILAFTISACTRPQQSILCDEPLITKDELKELKELNATLGLLVLGMKKSICFKHTRNDNSVAYLKVVFDNNSYDKYKSYFRGEVSAIDSMKKSYAWQLTYESLNGLLNDSKMIECKDVPK